MTFVSNSNKRKRRPKKTRTKKARDPDVITQVIDLGSGDIEEIVDFEEDTVPLRMDISMGGISGSEESADIPKVSRLQQIFFISYLALVVASE